VTSSRVGRRRPDERLRLALPLTPVAFDLLHLDGEDMLDRPTSERAQALEQLAPSALRVPRLVPASPAEAAGFLAGALARGHEWTVHVRPELVVEVAFEGVQRSARYPAGDGAPLRPGATLPARQARR